MKKYISSLTKSPSKGITRKFSQNASTNKNYTSTHDLFYNNKPGPNDDIIKQLLTVLKMRLSIENINNYTNRDLVGFIKDNLNLIDLDHVEINSINKFMDELVEIIINKYSTDLNTKEENVEEFKTTGLFNSIKYHPRATSEEHFRKRRTIEIALEKPKGIKKGPLKFNLFDKDRGKTPEKVAFYKDLDYNYEVFNVKNLETRIIDEISNKKCNKN